MVSKRKRGDVFVIGGHESKEAADAEILRQVVEGMCAGPLMVITAASEMHEELKEDYEQIFGDLGVKQIEVLMLKERADALDPELAKRVGKAGGFFFTGGDQLVLTSRLGGTPTLQAIVDRHEVGAVIAGTSAGAACMSATMLISGPSDRSSTLGEVEMAPGLDLIDGMIADTHFSERGRISRLVSAVARNPSDMGIGLDEDTAVRVTPDWLEVLGSGAAYLVDARQSGWSSLGAGEGSRDDIVRIHDVRLHVLARGDRFDWKTFRPLRS